MTLTWRRIVVGCGLGLHLVGLGFLAGVGAADAATLVVAGERP